jgi:hypothetical protein
MTGRTGDATAAAITQAAAHLLARHEDPTVGAVAQAIGVARGTIHRYFPRLKLSSLVPGDGAYAGKSGGSPLGTVVLAVTVSEQ